MLGWTTVLAIADDLCKRSGGLNIAMLIHRDRGVRIRIRIINVPVRVNAVQIRHAIRTPVVKLDLTLTLTLSVILTLLGPVN